MESRESRRRRWEQHVANWRQSGEAVLKWCRENNLSYNQFWYWRKKFTPSSATTFKNSKRVSFSELSDSHDCPAGIDILVGGKAIRLHKNFDEATLKSCLRLFGFRKASPLWYQLATRCSQRLRRDYRLSI